MAEKDRLRTKCVRIKLTDDEWQYVKDKSKYCGLTMSEYTRKVIRDGVIIKLETFDIKGLSNELNKIGTNINQIAKHVNETGAKYLIEDMECLIKEFSEMEQIIFNAVYGL